MAISEACQVWIEQRVEEELEEGRSYRSIGRTIAAEIERIFKARVNPRTIEKRAERTATFVAPLPTPQEHTESKDNQEPRKHIATGEKPDGGTREGAGRKAKYLYTETFEVTHALDFAAMAISQLERINKDDPLREEALNEVQTWINNNRRKIQ